MSHYEERLEQDLTVIKDKVEELATQVEAALQSAKLALLSGDEEAAYMTVLGDNQINRNSRNVDRLCHAFIARHAPSAGHLRLMSSVVRVNVALERIGDYAVTICRESARLDRSPKGSIARHLTAVSAEAQDLLKRAVDAFNEGNAEQARALMPMTARVETMMDGVYDELIEHGNERKPRELVAVFVVFNLLKRISDQAKNICDQTVFAVDGETKPRKVFRILFVDRDNALYGQLAEAIGNRHHSEFARFESAGLTPASDVDSQALEYLNDQGYETDAAGTRGIDALDLDLSKFGVVIALGGELKEFVDDMPFHTSGLSWSTPAMNETNAHVETVHDEIANKLSGLMTILVGKDAI